MAIRFVGALILAFGAVSASSALVAVPQTDTDLASLSREVKALKAAKMRLKGP